MFPLRGAQICLAQAHENSLGGPGLGTRLDAHMTSILVSPGFRPEVRVQKIVTIPSDSIRCGNRMYAIVGATISDKSKICLFVTFHIARPRCSFFSSALLFFFLRVAYFFLGLRRGFFTSSPFFFLFAHLTFRISLFLVYRLLLP